MPLLGFFKLILVILALILGLWIFFLPALISRSTKNHHLICTLNLLWGWTGVVWAIALLWALKDRGWLPESLKRFAENVHQFILIRRVPLTFFLCEVIAFIWDFKRYKKTEIFFDFNIFSGPGPHIMNFLSFQWLPMSLQLLFALGITFLITYKKRNLLESNFWVLTAISFLLFVLALYFVGPDTSTYLAIYWTGIFLCTWTFLDLSSTEKQVKNVR